MQKLAGPIVASMLNEIASIDAALDGITFLEFCSDWTLRRAVQRGIEIVSEASRRLPDALKGAHPEVNWRQVAGIGNILRHEYHAISDKVIWDVVYADFPELQRVLTTMQAELHDH